MLFSLCQDLFTFGNAILRQRRQAFSLQLDDLATVALQNTDASPHLETSLALFEAIDEPYYVCWVLHRLGYIYYNLNDHDTANKYTEQSLALARVTHNRVALVTYLYNLGSDYILNSEYIKGKSYCEEALHIATETGHQGQIAHGELCRNTEKNITTANLWHDMVVHTYQRPRRRLWYLPFYHQSCLLAHPTCPTSRHWPSISLAASTARSWPGSTP